MENFNRQSTIDNRQSADALIVVTTALMAIGVVMVASTSASLDRSLLATGWWGTLWGRHLVFALAGLALMGVTSRAALPCLSSPRWRRFFPRILFVLTLGCLVAVLIPGLGLSSHGSGRWLRLSLVGVPTYLGIGFQPSELAKPMLVLLLASLLGEHGADPRSFRRSFLPASIVIGVCVLLVGKEDFSTSVLLAGVGGSMLFMAGCRLRHLGMTAVLGVGGLVALLYAAPYRLARLAAYQDFWGDPRGAGYQPIQSLATIASGGWFGTGLGSGVQKYGYLPESHTDFIFAVICEEMGAFGGGLVIVLFCLFVWLGLRTMWVAQTRFERLLAFGLTCSVGLQALMNLAVVTVVAPTTGISLPLISAGGSGTLTFCFSIGLLAAIARKNEMIVECRLRNVE